MRISDWSSDMCSSDLREQLACAHRESNVHRVLPDDHSQRVAGRRHIVADRKGEAADSSVYRRLDVGVAQVELGALEGSLKPLHFAERLRVLGLGLVDRKSKRLNSSH